LAELERVEREPHSDSGPLAIRQAESLSEAYASLRIET
jgi:hypothetical protein